MRDIIKLSAICNNCGCPDMEERHDHLWCDWCGNEHSRPLTLQEAMREAANKIKLDI